MPLPLFLRRLANITCLAFLAAPALQAAVVFESLPQGGVQPQAITDPQGRAHLVWLSGDPRNADVFYQQRSPDGWRTNTSVRVNSQAGSAIAVGSVRGAQLAISPDGGVHVIWNGSGAALPKSETGTPLLYSRWDAAAGRFEPQRNLMTKTKDLDGGGGLAVDGEGRVFVFWHAGLSDKKTDESTRRVFLSLSVDGGKTFATERAVDEGRGVCGCCGMAASAGANGEVFALYRTATQIKHREMTLLSTKDHGRSFQPLPIHLWETASCPMSTAQLLPSAKGFQAVWETEGQIYGRITNDSWPPTGAPRRISSMKGSKHPAMASNTRGETLVVWTEGTGWQRGGVISWQLFDSLGRPTADKGTRPGIPVWGFGAVYPRPSGDFVIVY